MPKLTKAFAILLIIGIMWGFYSVTNAFGQHVGGMMACNPYPVVSAYLETKWSETLKDTQQGPQYRFEFWANADGSTWSILRIDQNEYACLVASGNEQGAEESDGSDVPPSIYTVPPLERGA
jgi:hypothetical protein